MQTMKPAAGAKFPALTWAAVAGDRIDPANASGWRMLVVYRGKHCPLCNLPEHAERTARRVPRVEHRRGRAVARGVFGAPAMFVGGQLFFGQDRLDFVREALRAQ